MQRFEDHGSHFTAGTRKQMVTGLEASLSAEQLSRVVMLRVGDQPTYVAVPDGSAHSYSGVRGGALWVTGHGQNLWMPLSIDLHRAPRSLHLLLRRKAQADNCPVEWDDFKASCRQIVLHAMRVFLADGLQHEWWPDAFQPGYQCPFALNTPAPPFAWSQNSAAFCDRWMVVCVNFPSVVFGDHLVEVRQMHEFREQLSHRGMPHELVDWSIYSHLPRSSYPVVGFICKEYDRCVLLPFTHASEDPAVRALHSPAYTRVVAPVSYLPGDSPPPEMPLPTFPETPTAALIREVIRRGGGSRSEHGFANFEVYADGDTCVLARFTPQLFRDVYFLLTQNEDNWQVVWTRACRRVAMLFGPNGGGDEYKRRVIREHYVRCHPHLQGQRLPLLSELEVPASCAQLTKAHLDPRKLRSWDLDYLHERCIFGWRLCPQSLRLWIVNDDWLMCGCDGCGRSRLLTTSARSILVRRDNPPVEFFSEEYVSKCASLHSYMHYTYSARVVCVNSGMGTGKTHFLKEYLRDREDRGTMRVLAITCRRTLADHLSKELEGFTNYQQVARGTLSDQRLLVVQLESLARLVDESAKRRRPLPVPDLLVLDEYLSLLKHFRSPTMHSVRLKVYSAFEALLRHSTRVLVLDADLEHYGTPADVLHLTNRMMRDECRRNDQDQEWPHFLHNLVCPRPRKTFFVMPRERWLDAMREAHRHGDPLALASSSLREAKAIVRQLEEDSPDLRDSMVISSESSQEEILEVAACNEQWAARQLVVFTPTITVGVSYEVNDGRTVYLYGSHRSADAETLLQMAGRLRKATRVCVTMDGKSPASEVLWGMFNTDAIVREHQDQLLAAAAEFLPVEVDFETLMVRMRKDYALLDAIVLWGTSRAMRSELDLLSELKRSAALHGDLMLVSDGWGNPRRPDVLEPKVRQVTREAYEARGIRISEDWDTKLALARVVGADGASERLTPRVLSYLYESRAVLANLRVLRQAVPVGYSWVEIAACVGRQLPANEFNYAYKDSLRADYDQPPFCRYFRELLAQPDKTNQPLSLCTMHVEQVHRVAELCRPFIADSPETGRASIFAATVLLDCVNQDLLARTVTEYPLLVHELGLTKKMIRQGVSVLNVGQLYRKLMAFFGWRLHQVPLPGGGKRARGWRVCEESIANDRFVASLTTHVLLPEPPKLVPAHLWKMLVEVPPAATPPAATAACEGSPQASPASSFVFVPCHPPSTPSQ